MADKQQRIERIVEGAAQEFWRRVDVKWKALQDETGRPIFHTSRNDLIRQIMAAWGPEAALDAANMLMEKDNGGTTI